MLEVAHLTRRDVRGLGEGFASLNQKDIKSLIWTGSVGTLVRAGQYLSAHTRLLWLYSWML